MPNQKSQVEYQDDVMVSEVPAPAPTDVVGPKPSRVPSVGQALNDAKTMGQKAAPVAGGAVIGLGLGYVYGREFALGRGGHLKRAIIGKPSTAKRLWGRLFG